MKTVLITGITGAIGSAVGRVFLREDSSRLVFIIRAESEAHLQQRVEALFAFWELDPADPALRGRIRAFRGDLGLPRLGLGRDDYEWLIHDVTHIIHCAGNVKLNHCLQEARQDTLGPLRKILALAREAKAAGPFRKLDVLSTVGVAGCLPGRLAEEPVTKQRSFHNTYEAAKAEGEDILLAEMQRGLPITIHRPSMVIGDSETGRIVRFQVFYYLCEFLSGRRTFGFVPETGDHCLDIIPADYVARALLIASDRQDTAGRIFHLCSGPGKAIRLSRLADRVRVLFRQGGLRVPRLWPIPVNGITRVLPWATRLAPRALRRSLATLPHFLAYLNEDQGFDNALSDAFFRAQGLFLPRPEDCLRVSLGRYLGDAAGRRK